MIKPKRSYHTTTNSKNLFHKHKNRIQELVPHRPEQIWVGDITYIEGHSCNTYLALITDAYSKKIVGDDLSSSLDASGCVRALKASSMHRQYPDKPLIHHPDKGIQYCCDAYQRVLTKCKMDVSRTLGCDPYANSVAEKVNGIIKQEFVLESFEVDTATMRSLT